MALGKPAIATPTRLEQRPVADAVSNIRQRIEAIEAALNTTTAIAGTTVNTTGTQIAALQQQLTALTAIVNSISNTGGSATAADDANLTIAQAALHRHAPAPPPPPADALNILATQIFGA
jgi:hypothetical protein